MSNKTDFLSLVLPENNEFNDGWDIPVNSNFEIVDSAIEEISNELASAKFTKTSLAEFLTVSHFDDGTLKPSEEMDDARNSLVYGDDSGGTDFELKDRLELADKETFDAREGLNSLLDSLARRARGFDHLDSILDGPKDSYLQPNFLTCSGAEFLLNGDPTEVVFNINGYYMRFRTDESLAVTGGDGTRYLYAIKPSTPITTLDRSSAANGASAENALNNDKCQILQDSGVNFSTSNVKSGDVLEILNSANAGTYIIDTVAFDGNSDQISIKGRFKSIVSGLNFKIYDPLMPELGVDTTKTPAVGKCYIGEGTFASGALTASLTYNFKGEYDSHYEAIDVSSLASFEKTFNHQLGDFPKTIQIYASQANDGSEPLEPLSVDLVGNDLAAVAANTLSYTPGVHNPGTSDATYTPGTLVGGVTCALTGAVYNLKSVSIKITKTQIFIKNVKDNHFYRDYDGSDRTTGYLKVVCKK